MDRINGILHNEQYISLINRIEMQEKSRIYCKHDLEHLLDVARIGMIIASEEHVTVEKDIIYAAALMHDIGRADLSCDIPHQHNSIKYAKNILSECGFNKSEIDNICNAIESHNSNENSSFGLSYVLYKADKLSRNCFCCKARSTCYWPEDVKNKGVTY